MSATKNSKLHKRLAILSIIIITLCGVIFYQNSNGNQTYKTLNQKYLKKSATQDQINQAIKLNDIRENKAKNKNNILTLTVMNIFTSNVNLTKISEHVYPSHHNKQDVYIFSEELVKNQNQIFKDSGVNIRLKLIQTVIDPQKILKTSGSWYLDSWTNPNMFPTSHLARTKNNADIVMMYTGRLKNAGGIANQNSNFRASDAIGAIDQDSQLSPFGTAYAHELGHTLDLDHDRKTLAAQGDKNATNFKRIQVGYIDPTGYARDIMSYDTGCKNKNDCVLVSQYSNANRTVKLAYILPDHSIAVGTYKLGDKYDDCVGFMNSHLLDYAKMDYLDNN